MAIADPQTSSDLYKPRKSKIIDGKVITVSDMLVHTFDVGDVEDPDIVAGFQLGDWERSEAGQWVMTNAVETPYWIRRGAPEYWGHKYHVVARMRESDQTFFKLKWGKE